MSTTDHRAQALRRRLVEGPASVGAGARRRRWELFARSFPDLDRLRVLDLGGTTESWQRSPVRPAAVTVLNLHEPGAGDEAVRPVTGDACEARAVLGREGLPTAYDLVFSNSLLEHVGGHARRVALAGEVRALAPRHWVQTPYRYFPVEPHWLFPGLQFLPVAVRARVAWRWPLQHTRPASARDALDEVQWTELVGVRELRSYFPHSHVVREQWAGVTKSLVALRT